MKKSLLLAIASCFLLSGIALAYTSADLETATYLANQGIINKQSVAANYRLDANVSRYEIMIVSLRLKGVDLNQSYTCKGYFSDVQQNNQTCKVVELAADNGIVSRSNAKARPSDSITRIESLAVILRAMEQDKKAPILPAPFPFSDVSAEWQKNTLWSAEQIGVIEYPDYPTKGLAVGKWWPNNFATRAEVFGFAGTIKSGNNSSVSYIRFNNSTLGVGFNLPEGYPVSSNEFGTINPTEAHSFSVRKESTDYRGVGKLSVWSESLGGGSTSFADFAQVLYDVNNTTSDLKTISIDGKTGFEFDIQDSFSDGEDGGFRLEGRVGKIVIIKHDNKAILFVIDGDDEVYYKAILSATFN